MGLSYATGIEQTSGGEGDSGQFDVGEFGPGVGDGFGGVVEDDVSGVVVGCLGIMGVDFFERGEDVGFDAPIERAGDGGGLAEARGRDERDGSGIWFNIHPDIMPGGI